MLSLLLPAALALLQARPAAVRPRVGLVITRSVRIAPGTWRLPAPASLDSAVITVRGEGISVDFAGATLEGMAPESDPDRASGVAIRVEGGSDVRILRARVRGYRIGILVTGTSGLELVGNDASYTWKPRLYSLVEHESLVDWLSFHHDEQGEWLRYGAGIYLDGVRGGTLVGNRAEQGMNGLLMARSDHLRIVDNDFSFNSGLGIGLYRASDNVLVRNRFDYDVRGYSHRFYHRGQDSAGLLMFEQCARNVVAWNSATHGGDGLFLWAGQSTMDSGAGGANDNLFYGNDFSWAPANGMEATFSRNAFVMNRARGNDYGLWGGYSWGSTVVGNTFVDNRVGIAIEHGQDNVIAGNRFERDTTAISLWANPIEPSDWGYPKHHDTRSRGYRIERNLFSGNRVAMRVAHTTGLAATANAWVGLDSFTVLRDTTGFQVERNAPLVEGADEWPLVPPEFAALAPSVMLSGAHAVPETPLAGQGRSAIVVDEWGPYDWRSPKLWPVDSSRALPLHLAVLGPAGRWSLVSRRGVERLSATSGRVGDTLAVTPATRSVGDWEVTLEYRGEATTSPRGTARAAGTPYRFSYGRFEPPVEWTVRFFAWTDASDPRSKPDAFDRLLAATPLLVRHTPRLDYEWYRPTIDGVPQAHFALEAEGTLPLPPGTYTLRTISDDAVRVWVDGLRVIDNWTPHESVVDVATLTGGRHHVLVQHYQVEGWTELRLDVVRGRQRAGGSPGPH